MQLHLLLLLLLLFLTVSSAAPTRDGADWQVAQTGTQLAIYYGQDQVGPGIVPICSNDMYVC